MIWRRLRVLTYLLQMSGETNLNRLLSTISPVLRDGEFVFLTFKESVYGDHDRLRPIASIMEREGLSVVVPKSKADENALEYGSVFRCITLNVHSSLDAVGLTAAVSKRLTECNLSANVIAGFFHDHILVETSAAARALSEIQGLSQYGGRKNE